MAMAGGFAVSAAQEPLQAISLYDFCNSSGNFAKLTAIRRASSLDRRLGC